MSSGLHRTNKGSASFALRWVIAVCLFLIPLALAAQTSQSGSLADVARQVRAQKEAQANADTGTAQQVADELSEDQNHNDDAPAGFKTYNAGGYSVWVPAPYTVGSRDDRGVVLSGPTVGSKRPMVVVGKAIVLPPEAGEGAFHDAAIQFSHQYAKTATCGKAAVAALSAYQCRLAAADLAGTRVSGNAWFLRNSNNVYPVVCAAPAAGSNDSHTAGKENTGETLDRDDPEVRSIWQKCDMVFQSIRPMKSKAQPAAAQAGGDGAAGLPSPAAARAAAAPAYATASTAPAGYKVHAFHYCRGPQQCWDASVLVPAEAQLISSDCKQYVFESKVQGTSFLLMAGPAVGDCDGSSADGPNLVHWKQLADPESKRAPGTYNTVSTQTAKLDGKLATLTTMHFRSGLTDWMGRRAEVESNGVSLVVGCIAPRDHFDDGDTVCSTLIGSLQMP